MITCDICDQTFKNVENTRIGKVCKSCLILLQSVDSTNITNCEVVIEPTIYKVGTYINIDGKLDISKIRGSRKDIYIECDKLNSSNDRAQLIYIPLKV